MKKLIVVADWAQDTLTCQEIRSTVEGYLKDPSNAKISFVTSTPSTMHTSFIVSQVVEIEERNGRPRETVIFENTDPRIQTQTGVKEARGAEFVIARLFSGMYVCGPNAGYNFSLIKPKIDELFTYQGLAKGSQFRSRDLYSRVVSHLMDKLEEELDLDEEHTHIIPEIRERYLLHIDNYGNLKTNIKLSEFKSKYDFGDFVKVTINGVLKDTKFVSNLFGAIPGELVIYPGSSGTKDDPYLEISVWRHFTEKDVTTGLYAFKNPRPGMKIGLGRLT